MTNPFITPYSPMVRLEQRRRQQFTVGVYVVLITMALLLLGMLIQGCSH